MLPLRPFECKGPTLVEQAFWWLYDKSDNCFVARAAASLGTELEGTRSIPFLSTFLLSTEQERRVAAFFFLAGLLFWVFLDLLLIVRLFWGRVISWLETLAASPKKVFFRTALAKPVPRPPQLQHATYSGYNSN
jgi:hypothetical protein